MMSGRAQVFDGAANASNLVIGLRKGELIATQPMREKASSEHRHAPGIGVGAAVAVKRHVAFAVKPLGPIVDVARPDADQPIIDDAQLGVNDDGPIVCCDRAVGMEPAMSIRPLETL